MLITWEASDNPISPISDEILFGPKSLSQDCFFPKSSPAVLPWVLWHNWCLQRAGQMYLAGKKHVFLLESPRKLITVYDSKGSFQFTNVGSLGRFQFSEWCHLCCWKYKRKENISGLWAHHSLIILSMPLFKEIQPLHQLEGWEELRRNLPAVFIAETEGGDSASSESQK